MRKKSKAELNDIKMLILDVDGVLTDGRIIINSDGSETKQFQTLDGHGIRMWRRAGLEVAFLSGRFSEPTIRRAEQLDIQYVFQNAHEKLEKFQELLEETSLRPQNIAYIGDDLPDIPVMRKVGFAVAVANAVDEVKEYADLITTRTGGSGAVREAIEYILKSKGQWQELLEKYVQ
ncbi:MAG: KdsC family phosphatase [Planctomycetota bacterium]|jgi:3-deoxy-D-manno-octulosonate 8-phosphate phosphatase (KDO 8-P phosphatase)